MTEEKLQFNVVVYENGVAVEHTVMTRDEFKYEDTKGRLFLATPVQAVMPKPEESEKMYVAELNAGHLGRKIDVRGQKKGSHYRTSYSGFLSMVQHGVDGTTNIPYTKVRVSHREDGTGMMQAATFGSGAEVHVIGD